MNINLPPERAGNLASNDVKIKVKALTLDVFNVLFYKMNGQYSILFDVGSTITSYK